jgi:hypothetical protein
VRLVADRHAFDLAAGRVDRISDIIEAIVPEVRKEFSGVKAATHLRRKAPAGEGQFRLRGHRLASVLRYSLKADEARA